MLSTHVYTGAPRCRGHCWTEARGERTGSERWNLTDLGDGKRELDTEEGGQSLENGKVKQ